MGRAHPDSRIRLLFVSKWMDVGGAERFVSTALHHLDPARFDLRLCLFRRILGYPVPDGVPLSVLSAAMAHRDWHLPPMIWRLAREIDRQQPDIVFSAYSYPSFVVGSALRLTRRRPRWIARVASNPLWHESGLRRLVMRLLYRRADLVLANSAALGSAFEQRYPFARGRVQHQPNPTDFDRIDLLAREPLGQELPDRPLLVAVGRLSAEKRVDLLIEALASVRRQIDADLVLCGDGPRRADLEARVDALGLRGNVRFAGFCRNPFPWMARADLFLLSSDVEGSPNALIEAQGLGLPAVATDCPFGPSEIVEPEKTGWLVPTGDPEALAAAIVAALRDPARLREMRAAARVRTREAFAADRACALLARHLELAR